MRYTTTISHKHQIVLFFAQEHFSHARIRRRLRDAGKTAAKEPGERFPPVLPSVSSLARDLCIYDGLIPPPFPYPRG